MLLSTSVQGFRLQGRKYDEDSNSPPKEASPFTQAQVKKWMERSYWRDEALPTTPSYNDGDEEAYTHPAGQSLGQKADPQDKWFDGKTTGINGQWTDGNGHGSEKLDYWWHLDHHQNEKGPKGEDWSWDPNAKSPGRELASWNHFDDEPKSHPMGITA